MAPVATTPPQASKEVQKTCSKPSDLSSDRVRPTSPPPSDPIPALRSALTSETTPLAVRFRALFSLKHHASLKPPDSTTLPAIQAIAAAFPSPSALLKHELAYCLGQSNNLDSAPYLQTVFRDEQEDSMCRHEAAEALGALGDLNSRELLETYAQDERQPVVVRETCEIAVERIRWAHSESGKRERLKVSDFASIDPAPPLAGASPAASLQDNRRGDSFSIEELRQRLLDTRLGLFERYRAMFALRDLASPPDLPTAVPAVEALATGFTDKSALFRHEVAFVFGQLSHKASIPALVAVLGNLKEESMVRHEAAEALGSLGEEDGVEEILRRFLDDEEVVVRESVVVALDMAEFERSGVSEYAALPA